MYYSFITNNDDMLVFDDLNFRINTHTHTLEPQHTHYVINYFINI